MYITLNLSKVIVSTCEFKFDKNHCILMVRNLLIMLEIHGHSFTFSTCM